VQLIELGNVLEAVLKFRTERFDVPGVAAVLGFLNQPIDDFLRRVGYCCFALLPLLALLLEELLPAFFVGERPSAFLIAACRLYPWLRSSRPCLRRLALVLGTLGFYNPPAES